VIIAAAMAKMRVWVVLGVSVVGHLVLPWAIPQWSFWRSTGFDLSRPFVAMHRAFSCSFWGTEAECMNFDQDRSIALRIQFDFFALLTYSLLHYLGTKDYWRNVRVHWATTLSISLHPLWTFGQFFFPSWAWRSQALAFSNAVRKIHTGDVTSFGFLDFLAVSIPIAFFIIRSSGPIIAVEVKFTQRLYEMWEIADRNGDGKVTKPELIKALRGFADLAEDLNLPQNIRQEDGTRQQFEEFFQNLDTNNDRNISWEEFSFGLRERMKKQFLQGQPAVAKIIQKARELPKMTIVPLATIRDAPSNQAVATGSRRPRDSSGEEMDGPRQRQRIN
jgi:hypothetical protein